MNRDELKKMISLIDDDKLTEANAGEAKQVRPAGRTFWRKSALIAAAVFIVTISVYLVWALIKPGLWPFEKTNPATTSASTTETASMPVPRWDELEVQEQYIGGAMINGIEYQSSARAIDASLIETVLGSLQLSGYDFYADKTHQIEATYYQVKNIDPDCVVAVRYEGYEGYYGFFNSGYQFKTLDDLITRLNLPVHMQLNNIFIHNIWQGETQKELLRWDYYSLPDQKIVWDILLANRAIINEGESARYKLGWEIMSISIDYAPAGQSNIGIVLFDNGYLCTNILGSLQSFYIGKESVMAFRDYVLENGTLNKSIGLETPGETTVPESYAGVATTQETTKSNIHTRNSLQQMSN